MVGANIRKKGFDDLLATLGSAAGFDLAEKWDPGTLIDIHQSEGSLIDWLLDQEEVSERDFSVALGKGLDLAYDDNPETDPAAVDLIKSFCPAQVAIRNRVLPLRIEFPPGGEKPSSIVIASYDPFYSLGRMLVRRSVDLPIQWVLVPRRMIFSGLQTLYGVGGDIFEDLFSSRDWAAEDFSFKEEINVIDDDDETASVVKFVNQILSEALKQRATDIHIEPLQNDLRVRLRIDGVLRRLPAPDRIVALQSSVIARVKLMAGLDIAEKRKPQDGRISLQIGGEPIDTRVATVPGIEGESISLRLLGQERFEMDRLEMYPELRREVEEVLSRPNGIVLVTGPTGCGKSTSLFCFLSHLNSEERKIITIEDPVENRIEGALQIAVKPDIDLTFASGLRSVLRSDPNVIMVGEIRDLETAEISVQASLTGHLVFSTLHTNDSVGGITRLIDMGVEPFLIAASVRAFMAQRLVRLLCRECRVRADYPAEFLRKVGFPTEQKEHIFEASPQGCEACGFSGYRGRTALYEMFRITDKVHDLVVNGAPRADLLRQGMLDGFIGMRDYGWRKVIDGKTTIEEVVSSTEIG